MKKLDKEDKVLLFWACVVALALIAAIALLIYWNHMTPEPVCTEGFVYVPSTGICSPGYRP